MRHHLLVLLMLAFAALAADAAHALDKVDSYICPTAAEGSGMDCFLEAVPQTYTMCREVKSIEIIEFGLTGAQEGVNGAKTESCIDKHRLKIARPYQAALRESTYSKQIVQSLRELYDLWLASLAKLLPQPGETDQGYKQRVIGPYGEFSERIKAIRELVASSAKPAAPVSKPKKRSS